MVRTSTRTTASSHVSSRGRRSVQYSVFYKLKIPPARFRDGTGHTSTRATPRPTVKPTQTLTSWSAVRKPDKYDSVESFEADLDLMIDNAITFNGADSEVGQVAMVLRDKYRDLLSSLRGTGPVKRKSGDKSTPQPSKKARLG